MQFVLGNMSASHIRNYTLTGVTNKYYSEINTSISKELYRAFLVWIVHWSEEFLKQETVQRHTVLNLPVLAYTNVVISVHS